MVSFLTEQLIEADAFGIVIGDPGSSLGRRLVLFDDGRLFHVGCSSLEFLAPAP